MKIIHESVVEKAKKFIVNNKGKLAALAAVGAGGAIAHHQGWLGKPAELLAKGAEAVGLDNVADKLEDYARDQRIAAGDASIGDYISKGFDWFKNHIPGSGS